MWCHVDDRRADDVFAERLAPAMTRPPEDLRGRLAFGPAERVVEKLAAFRDAGVQWMFLWPVAFEIEQLHRLAEEVVAPLRG